MWAGTDQQRTEHFRFFQHLSLAGLVEGKYTGVGSGSLTNAVIGTNVPRLKMDGIGVSIYVNQGNPWTTVWPDTHGLATDTRIHELQFGKEASGSITGNGGLSVQNIKSLDDKLDDGHANDGFWRMPSGYASCNTGTAPNYSYNISYTEPECLLIVLTKWW